jgi:hypothetical protein
MAVRVAPGVAALARLLSKARTAAARVKHRGNGDLSGYCSRRIDDEHRLVYWAGGKRPRSWIWYGLVVAQRGGDGVSKIKVEWLERSELGVAVRAPTSLVQQDDPVTVAEVIRDLERRAAGLVQGQRRECVCGAEQRHR